MQFAQQTRFKAQPSPMKQNAYVSKGYNEMSNEMQLYSNNESLEMRESSFEFVEEQRTNQTARSALVNKPLSSTTVQNNQGKGYKNNE